MATGYRTEFKDYEGTVWDINITDTWANSQDNTLTNYKCGSDGFRLKYQGETKDIFDPIKSSSVKMSLFALDSSGESTLLTPFNNPVDNWYLIIFKDEVLYWWGYLTNKTPRILNESYPKILEIEAVDLLALSKEINFWDYRVELDRNFLGIPVSLNNETEWYGDTPLTTNALPSLRMGAPYGTLLANFQPFNTEPTIVEFIHSLLFDLDRDPDGDLVIWDFYTQNTDQNKSRLQGLYGSTKVNIEPYVKEDNGSFDSNNVWIPNIELIQVSIHELLSHMMEYLNCRIFQRDGEYYVVPIDGINLGADKTISYWYNPGNTDQYTWFKYNRDTASTAGTPNQQPKDNGFNNTSNDESEYTFSISQGSAPSIASGGSFDYTESVRYIKSKFEKVGTQSAPQQTSIDYIMKDSSSNSVNLASSSAPNHKTPSEGGRMKWTEQGTSILGKVGSGTSAIYVWFSAYGVSRPSASNPVLVGSFIEHHVRARFEFLKGTRTKLQAIIIGSGPDPVKRMTYDSKNWLWSGMELTANSVEWDIEFDELTYDKNASANEEILKVEP